MRILDLFSEATRQRISGPASSPLFHCALCDWLAAATGIDKVERRYSSDLAYYARLVRDAQLALDAAPRRSHKRSALASEVTNAIQLLDFALRGLDRALEPFATAKRAAQAMEDVAVFRAVAHLWLSRGGVS